MLSFNVIDFFFSSSRLSLTSAYLHSHSVVLPFVSLVRFAIADSSFWILPIISAAQAINSVFTILTCIVNHSGTMCYDSMFSDSIGSFCLIKCWVTFFRLVVFIHRCLISFIRSEGHITICYEYFPCWFICLYSRSLGFLLLEMFDDFSLFFIIFPYFSLSDSLLI